MRAPELQLIDRLEKLKNELKGSTPAIPISLSEYQRNLFSTLKDKISEADTTDADNTKKTLDLIKDALTITLNLVNALIARANSVPPVSLETVMDSSDSDAEVEDTRMTEPDFEQLLHSVCATHSQQGEIEQLVMAAFFMILKDYRGSIEKICAEYDLAIPADNTHLVADFSIDYFKVDGKITLFRLQEMQYMLDKMLNASTDELAQLHPIRTLPYVRHMQVSDEIVNRIQLSKQELTERLSRIIKEVQNKLLSIVSANNYPETDVRFTIIAARQTQLLFSIERWINLLVTLRSRLQTFDELEDKTIIENFLTCVSRAEEKIAEFPALEKARMRIDFEFNGTDVAAMSAVAASSGVSAQELGIRRKEESRLGIINEIVNGLIDGMNRHQLAAGESISDFGLKDYLRELKEQTQSFDQTMLQLQNTVKIQTLVQKLGSEVEAFAAQCQPGRRPQTQAAPTSTAPAATLFSSRNTTVSGNNNRLDEGNTQTRHAGASNQGCAQQ